MFALMASDATNSCKNRSAQANHPSTAMLNALPIVHFTIRTEVRSHARRQKRISPHPIRHSRPQQKSVSYSWVRASLIGIPFLQLSHLAPAPQSSCDKLCSLSSCVSQSNARNWNQPSSIESQDGTGKSLCEKLSRSQRS